MLSLWHFFWNLRGSKVSKEVALCSGTARIVFGLDAEEITRIWSKNAQNP